MASTFTTEYKGWVIDPIPAHGQGGYRCDCTNGDRIERFFLRYDQMDGMAMAPLLEVVSVAKQRIDEWERG